MKSILKIIGYFALFTTLWSCGCNQSEMDSDVVEDYFEVDVLVPNEETFSEIGEKTSNWTFYCLLDDKDSICMHIECFAIWNVSRNKDPHAIKIIEVDTSWFYLTIHDGSEYIMSWRNQSDRPLLWAIKTILDTSTYSLVCINHDYVSPQTLLNDYIDSVVETKISFKMCFKKDDIPTVPDMQSGTSQKN